MAPKREPLTMEDREDISRGLAKGLDNKDIAAPRSGGMNRSFPGKSRGTAAGKRTVHGKRARPPANREAGLVRPMYRVIWSEVNSDMLVLTSPQRTWLSQIAKMASTLSLSSWLNHMSTPRRKCDFMPSRCTAAKIRRWAARPSL